MRTLIPLLLLITVTAQAAGPGKNAVASAHPLATEAGLNIPEQGGNAVDAAVAVAAVVVAVGLATVGVVGVVGVEAAAGVLAVVVVLAVVLGEEEDTLRYASRR